MPAIMREQKGLTAMKKRKHKKQYPQWPHPAGTYGDIQPVYVPPCRRVIKRALQWIALFVCFLIFVAVFGLAVHIFLNYRLLCHSRGLFASFDCLF